MMIWRPSFLTVPICQIDGCRTRAWSDPVLDEPDKLVGHGHAGAACEG
jgi:hypothetical protein